MSNPMMRTSATTTGSIFFSAPVEILEILWTDISASCSLKLNDMNNNVVFHGIAEAATNLVRVIEDPRIFPNGLRVSTSSSTNVEDGTLFIWWR